MLESSTARTIIIICIVIFNLIAFVLFGIDKKRAVERRWRISEKALFLVAIPGSALGALLGMYVFHHKTKHWYFRYCMPALFILQLAIAGIILYKCG